MWNTSWRMTSVPRSRKNNVKTGEKGQKSYRKPGHSVKIQSRLQGGYLRLHEPGIRCPAVRMVAGRGFRRTGLECTDRFGSGVHRYLYCQCKNKQRKQNGIVKASKLQSFIPYFARSTRLLITAMPSARKRFACSSAPPKAKAPESSPLELTTR